MYDRQTGGPRAGGPRRTGNGWLAMDSRPGARWVDADWLKSRRMRPETDHTPTLWATVRQVVPVHSRRTTNDQSPRDLRFHQQMGSRRTPTLSIWKAAKAKPDIVTQIQGKRSNRDWTKERAHLTMMHQRVKSMEAKMELNWDLKQTISDPGLFGSSVTQTSSQPLPECMLIRKTPATSKPFALRHMWSRLRKLTHLFSVPAVLLEVLT